MSLQSTGSVLVVFLWSLTVVLGQGDWDVTYSTQSICGLKGSTVELSCTYKYPSGHKVTSTFWFTRNDADGNPVNLSDDPDYRGRVTYHSDEKKRHILIITDLRESDSTEYKFRFTTNQPEGKWIGRPGVKLYSPGLQVEVTRGNKKTLTCRTTCPLTDNTTYIWYKNGQQINESSSPQYKDPVYSNYEDSYSCSVKGHEDLLSPTVCVMGQDCNRVTYTQRRICVLKGSSVDISCTYAGFNTVTSSLWFRSDKMTPRDVTKDPEYTGRVLNTLPSTLRITDLREEDSAEYRFTFKTSNFEWGHSFPGTTLTVTGLQVEMNPKEWSDWKTLTCRTTCSLTGNPTYIWYKNGQQIDESSSPQYKDSVYSEHRDSYSCSVKGHEHLHSPTVCVLGQDCNRVTYTKRRICVLKGSSVDISCTYAGYNPVISSLWFRSDKMTTEDVTKDPEYTGRVLNTLPSILRITDLREEDSAEYRFTFKTDNLEWGHSFPGTTLTVTGVQVEVSSDGWSDRKTLTCRTTCPLTGNPTYIWYKNGQQIDESSSPQYKDPVTSNYKDSYSCSVKGHEDLHSPTVCVQGQDCNRVTYTKSRICVLKGSSVDISCTYAGHNTVTTSLWFSPKQSGRWRDKLIPEDLITYPGYAGRVEYPDQESRRYRGPFTLRITDLREEDSAEYRFTFKTYKFEWGHSFPGTTLTVTDVQVNMSLATMTEGQSVTLTCITSCPLTDNPTYIWYKKNVTSLKASGQSYSITNIRSEDSGEYYCEVRNGRGSMNSSTLMVTVAGKQTSVLTASVGITVVVLVLILCFCGLIWFRMKCHKSPFDKTEKTDDGQRDSSPVYDNISDIMTSTAEQTADTDNQDDLHYASVYYSSSREQEVPLYSTTQKQEEEVQYVAVKFNCPSAATQPTTQTAEVDPSRIYSTI